MHRPAWPAHRRSARDYIPFATLRRVRSVAAALQPFMASMGFTRRGSSFHRLKGDVWQSVSVWQRVSAFSPDGSEMTLRPTRWTHIQLDALSLSARQALGRSARAVLPYADAHTPPPGRWGDIEPCVVSGWDWAAGPEAALAEMKEQLGKKIPEFFGPLSSSADLLPRVGHDLIGAVLRALHGDRRGAMLDCANMWMSRPRQGELDDLHLRWFSRMVFWCGWWYMRIRYKAAFDLHNDWRRPVRLVHEVLERSDSAYRMDPRVLTDEYYEEMVRGVAATARGLTPREIRELISETLTVDEDPNLLMIIQDRFYSREELERWGRD